MGGLSLGPLYERSYCSKSGRLMCGSIRCMCGLPRFAVVQHLGAPDMLVI